MESPKAYLNLLPLEVLFQIASDPSLSYLDMKSMRLVCRSLRDASTPAVFHTIVCSGLAKDKDALLQIASRPYLATHVKTLVWDELDMKGWAHDDSDVPPASSGDEQHSIIETAEDVWNLMKAAAHDCRIFWCPPMGRQREHFSPVAFFTAVRAMPNLSAFVSRPMPATRQIPYENYPFSADLYRNQHDDSWQRCNNGLFKYLLPALGQPDSTVKHLCWADESSSWSSFFRLNPDLSQHCFSKLQSFDLCLANRRPPAAGLISCLSAAKGLKELKVCGERGDIKLRPFDDDDSSPIHWEQLSILSLVDITLPPDNLTAFIRRHSKSLRHLKFHACLIPWDTILAMRDIEDLKLDSIEIIPASACGLQYTDVVKGYHLLPFINRNVRSCITSFGSAFYPSSASAFPHGIVTTLEPADSNHFHPDEDRDEVTDEESDQETDAGLDDISVGELRALRYS